MLVAPDLPDMFSSVVRVQQAKAGGGESVDDSGWMQVRGSSERHTRIQAAGRGG